MKKNKKISLEEATLQALQNELDNGKNDEVEGVVDDILVITDPEITSEDYEEVIERAQEIVDDTPEGEIPFDDQYVGEVAQTCPICGATFTEDHLLEQGEPCPICLEEPEAFVLVGKLEADKTTLDDEIDETTEEIKEEPTDTDKEEKSDEEDSNKEESKQIKGNVLTENESAKNKMCISDAEKKEEADLSKDLYQDEANRRIHTRLEFLDVYLEKFEDALKNNDTDNITLNKSKINGNIEYLIPALNIKGGVEGLIKYLTETDFDFENRFKETASLLRDATQETKTESKLNESAINQQTLLDTLSQVRNENKRDGLLGVDDFVLRCYEVYADLENKKNLTAEERNAINASAKDAYTRLEKELSEEDITESKCVKKEAIRNVDDLEVGDEVTIPYARGPKYTEDKSQWVKGKVININPDYADLEVPTTLTVTTRQLSNWMRKYESKKLDEQIITSSGQEFGDKYNELTDKMSEVNREFGSSYGTIGKDFPNKYKDKLDEIDALLDIIASENKGKSDLDDVRVLFDLATIEQQEDLRKLVNENKLIEDNKETVSFQEISDMMEAAESYSELYAAAQMIVDTKLETDVVLAIRACEDDGDDVDTAYSIVTSDLIDGEILAGNKNVVKTEGKSLSEKFIKFDSESDKEDYIMTHNLKINKDYKNKGPVAIELLKESADIRNYTTKLLDDCEMGVISWESVARECLSYMSEDDVKDMAVSAGFIDDDTELDEAKEVKTESEELVEQDDIIDAIQNCGSEAELEDLLSNLSDEVLSTVLLNDLYDLKSEMDDNGGKFNYMTTYIDNLCNKVEDYFDDPEEYAAQLEESKKQEAMNGDVLVTNKVFNDLMEMESFIESNGFDVLDFDMRNEEVTVIDVTKSDGISEIYKYEEQPDSTFKITKKIREEKI